MTEHFKNFIEFDIETLIEISVFTEFLDKIELCWFLNQN